MMNAACKGARLLARDFGEVEQLQVSKKGPADFVTAADHAVEEKIFNILRKARPGYGFLMEERGEIAGSDKTHRFIIDPLDGTLNFMHGNPHFAVSIAVERDGELQAGVIYDLIRDEMFYGETGNGAFLMDVRGTERRLRVADVKMCRAMIATGMPWKGKPGHAQFLKELHRVMAQAAGIRRFGSAALDLAWVAAGRFNGFWERGLKPWDIAAGMVIAREAGARITELDTDSEDPLMSGDIVCAAPALLSELIKHLSDS